MGGLWFAVVRAQGGFSRGIGWGLGCLLAKGQGKDSNLSSCLELSNLLYLLLCTGVPTVYQEILADQRCPDSSCMAEGSWGAALHRHSVWLLSSPLKCFTETTPWVGLPMGSTHRWAHRPHRSYSQHWMDHLLRVVPLREVGDPIKWESHALLSALVSCPRDCHERQPMLAFQAPCKAHQHLFWGRQSIWHTYFFFT